ncbi:MAG: hypothetical protein ACREKG_00715 [Candidatus Rokuibacteriota bacterium]
MACGARRRADADHCRVKVTDALAHSVGLVISPGDAATIFRRELKLAVIRTRAKQYHVVGLTPAVIATLWARVRWRRWRSSSGDGWITEV